MYINRARVLYKDTDSLFYEVRTADLYYDMRSLKTDLDLSSYPKEHPLFSEANRKVPLKRTDELNGAIVAEAVFLKPKAYSIAYVDGLSLKTKQSAKGVNHEVKKTLQHEKFKSVLFNGLTLKSSMVHLTSKNLKLLSTKSTK